MLSGSGRGRRRTLATLVTCFAAGTAAALAFPAVSVFGRPASPLRITWLYAGICGGGGSFVVASHRAVITMSTARAVPGNTCPLALFSV